MDQNATLKKRKKKRNGETDRQTVCMDWIVGGNYQVFDTFRYKILMTIMEEERS